MAEELRTIIKDIAKKFNRDKTRMMDVLIELQAHYNYIPEEALDLLAEEFMTHRVEIESVASFYSFFSLKPRGKVIIRLCNDVIDKLKGFSRIYDAFSKELGIKFGETTEDMQFTLEETACIGLSDQAPAAMINDVMVPELSSDKVMEIVKILKEKGDPSKLTRRFGVGDGNNAHPLVHSMVKNNIRKKGEVIFREIENGRALDQALSMSPTEVIRIIKASRLRGRGGAGFPTGLKWEFTRAADGEKKFIICNADEGEPGTFKDRVLLTEKPDLIFEGMTVAGYAIGAEEGILYLRGEYTYLKKFLESVLEERRKKNLLGKSILGHENFNFDIRIQLGAGAYVCGEETALISSCEGLRGDPKNRPPFPAQKGYLGYPTVVNNVETFCCVTRIMEEGASWFTQFGTQESSGTKLLSVSGDCDRPGVYEFPFGITVKELLKEVGGEDAKAVQIGGPSGQMIGRKDFDRKICYEDLATGGSIMIFGPERNILEIAKNFMEFFIHESCGYCTPCRVGNRLLKQGLEKIIKGKGEESDLTYLENLANTVKLTSRCGLGQTSPNPILTTLKNFRGEYEKLLVKNENKFNLLFDVKEALKESEKIAGRKSEIFR